jgi:hypothetical protein
MITYTAIICLADTSSSGAAAASTAVHAPKVNPVQPQKRKARDVTRSSVIDRIEAADLKRAKHNSLNQEGSDDDDS